MQYKKRRTRLEILTWFGEVDGWLKNHPSQRVPNLSKSHSKHDGQELFSHARWLMNHIREDLVSGVRVSEIRESLGVLRTILSFCDYVQSGDLTPYVKE